MMAVTSELLGAFERCGLLASADRHIAERVASLGGDEDPEVILAIACAARAPRHGHVAVDLATVATTAIAESTPDREPTEVAELSWPAAESWSAKVAASGLVSVLTDPHQTPDPARPLVLVGSLLYLQKYWVYERSVATALIRRAAQAAPDLEHGPDLKIASELLTGDGSEDQLRAVAAGLSRNLMILVGGPGTGKTTTVAALVAEILGGLGENQALSVALAAPTGKAAARLGEAFTAAIARLPAQSTDRLQGVEFFTIHRMLGASWQSPTAFRFHRDRPLPYDLVIVDEASMISMPLMARLLDALRPDARCVIVGDPGQLASVEAGSVLADIAAASPVGQAHEPERVMRLRYSHRFPGESPIGMLAAAINDGDAKMALEVLRDPTSGTAPTASLHWIDHGADDLPLDHEATRQQIRSLWRPAIERTVVAACEGDASAALGAMTEMRVLCAHRRGPFGVQRWNAVAEDWARAILRARSSPAESAAAGWWYPGKVVMVTGNDARRGLFNGDLGVVIRAEGRVMVAFPGSGGPRLVPTGRLEAVEPAAAMTIHKSQGSEFGHVMVVLPSSDSRLATRELLYTGITRAITRMTLVASPEAVEAAIHRRIARASGLRALLW